MFFTQDDPERTAHAYLGSYYLTGDKAMRDEDGYLWFLGRCDDVITSAGYVVHLMFSVY